MWLYYNSHSGVESFVDSDNCRKCTAGTLRGKRASSIMMARWCYECVLDRGKALKIFAQRLNASVEKKKACNKDRTLKCRGPALIPTNN